MNKITINCGDQSITTQYYDDTLTVDEYNNIVNGWYSKPNKKLINTEFNSLMKGKNKISNITRYYFLNLMSDVRLYKRKWTINEVFTNIDLIRHMMAKIKKNPKLYKDPTLNDNLSKVFSLGGKGFASRPSNFPLKTVREVLEKYNTNGNYYDFSCGWGVRLLGSLIHNVNYYGTDPNHLLVDKLNELSTDYKLNKPNSLFNVNSTVDIRCQGSEQFIPEWQNKMGLIFSSPPYYALEDYKHGNQSYKNNTTYDEWLSGYFTGTVNNIKKYLTDDGYFLININDYSKYQLLNDTKAIIINAGFTLVGYHKLNNVLRINSERNHNDNSELIMVFKKDT